jgi:hypothetical protein
MNRCLNLLEKPEVFLPAAALLALVLLVWAQLSVPRERKDLDRDFNLVCGFVWTYLAILFALVAVAIFINDKTNDYAKGFLILSFFMAVTNLLIGIVTTFIKLLLNIKRGRNMSGSLTKLRGQCVKIFWLVIFWCFLLIGLGFISFSPSLLRVRFCWSWQFILGLSLVGVALLYALVGIFHGWRRLCARLRQVWRKVWGKWKEWKEERDKRKRVRRHKNT